MLGNYSGIQKSGVRIQNSLRIRLQQFADLHQHRLQLGNIAVVEILDKNQVVARFLEGALRDVEKAKSVCFRRFLNPSAMFAAMDTAARRN